MMTYLILLCCIFNFGSLYTFNILEKPVCSVFTPNSILLEKENYHTLFAGDRKRYATCTGACWFHKNYVAALNLLGKKVITYNIDEKNYSFIMHQLLDSKHGLNIENAENLVASPDGTLLAICFDLPQAGVSIYSIDLDTHLINPLPIFHLKSSSLIHNVKFCPSGKFLATAGWNKELSVCIYEVVRSHNTIDLKLVCNIPNSTDTLKAKAVTFTENQRFIIIAYAGNISAQINDTIKTIINVHYFDPESGIIGELVCNLANSPGQTNSEDLILINNDQVLILTDQKQDILACYLFNPDSGHINPNYFLFKNPDAQLSFPHGMGTSADKKYLVVTNYGDDKFNLYKLY